MIRLGKVNTFTSPVVFIAAYLVTSYTWKLHNFNKSMVHISGLTFLALHFVRLIYLRQICCCSRSYQSRSHVIGVERCQISEIHSWHWYGTQERQTRLCKLWSFIEHKGYRFLIYIKPEQRIMRTRDSVKHVPCSYVHVYRTRHVMFLIVDEECVVNGRRLMLAHCELVPLNFVFHIGI